MSIYCGSCDHLNERKKRCDKFNQRLAYMKHTGAIKFVVFEKCAECNESFEWDKTTRRSI